MSRRRVHKFDTEVHWKFNGQIIKKDSNKKAEKKYLLRKRIEKDFFSLHITNVSEKDVSEYACKASAANFPKADEDEDFIELSLHNKGEFHLYTPLLCKFF